MSAMKSAILLVISGTATLAMLVGCGGSSSMHPSMNPPTMPPNPVLSQLKTTTTIGSTVDPMNGDSNPYGLAIAPVTSAPINAGDLIVCNFNDKNGNAGAGTTIEDLAPMANSTPKRIAQDPSLAGCDALALHNTNDVIWAAAYTANDNPVLKPTGTIESTLATSFGWMQPWGQIFALPSMTSGITANPIFYVSQAKNGSIVSVQVTSTGAFVYNTIISGFPSTVSPQNGILAPAGLTYDPNSDTLYIVSSDTNSVVAIARASTVPANGIMVRAVTSSSGGSSSTSNSSLTFSGPAMAQAAVVYSGVPLNFPVSSALLYNGDLVVGNTGDNNMVEIDPVHNKMVGTKLVDTGNPGAIFGIATSGSTVATQTIYFNDDNSNSVVSISQ
jgi:hypothetical protein